MKLLYFRIDPTHPNFDVAREDLITSWDMFYPQRVHEAFAIYKPDGTELITRVWVLSDDWWNTSGWNGHPMILEVYSKEVSAFSPFSDLMEVLDTWYPGHYPKASPLDPNKVVPIEEEDGVIN